LWGSTPTDQPNNDKAKALRGRRVGDDVLFYADSGFFARARVVGLFHNPALATAVWGQDDEGMTWEHIMALDEVQEFQPVPAATVLRAALSKPQRTLRGLTLVDAAAYSRVTPLLPPRGAVGTDGGSGSAAGPLAEPRLSSAELLAAFAQLSLHRLDGVPSRHQPLTLLWALGRLDAGEDRLVPWREFRPAVAPLLERYGLPGSRVSPEHPFWHLRGGPLWEVTGLANHPVKTPQLRLLEAANPLGGFTGQAAALLRDTVTRVRAVHILLAHHLSDVDRQALLADIGLAGYDSASGDTRQVVVVRGKDGETTRRETTTSQVVRDRQVAESVKALYGHECQVCGFRLPTVHGYRSDAAHVRGLGTPHNGRDILANLLCLCPHHHIQFDTFTIYIDDDHVVRMATDKSEIGKLNLHPDHHLDMAHVAYHRQLCGLAD
jgi:putative restriction endonuclease